MTTYIRQRFIAIIVAAIGLVAHAEIPAGYYDDAYNLSTSQLKTALSNIIKNHQPLEYKDLPTYFKETDVYPGTNQWWEMYAPGPYYLPWSGQVLNREHSLPKSWWGGNENTPAYSDINHLYPGEATANGKKLNYPLGEVKTVQWTNGVSKVGIGYNSGGASCVFEPADEYKGDFARTYFYMVTCYQDLNWETTWQVKNGTYPSLQQWAIDLLLKWHRNDKVSEKETLRNDKVHKFQYNRNPFIDYPELAEYIWGNKMGQNWVPESGETTTEPVLTAPINNTYIDFGEIGLGKSVTRQLLIKGSDFTASNLRLTIGGTDRQYFSIPGIEQTSTGASTMNISSTAAASPSGTWVNIIYTPTAIGSHEAVGSITGGGLKASVRFNIKAACLEAPTLSRPTNPQAIDITSDSYIATWDAPADDEIVDYWTVTRTIYSGNNVTTKVETSETNELIVTDFADSDHESFTVRAYRLGYESAESNVVVVNKSSINNIYTDAPMAIESHPGLIRVRCSTPLSQLSIFDLTGRLVTTVAGPICDGHELSLSKGVYIIAAPEHRTPIKAVAY